MVPMGGFGVGGVSGFMENSNENLPSIRFVVYLAW